MARLVPSGRPVNRVLDLDSSTNSFLDDSGYSSILNYSGNTIKKDANSSDIEKIETPSKGLENVSFYYKIFV